MARRPFLGYTPIMKTAGAGPLTVGNQRNILCRRVTPYNPRNIDFEKYINTGGYDANETPGKKGANIMLDGVYKPFASGAGPSGQDAGWADATILKSLLYLNTDGNTDKFTVAMKDNTSGYSEWVWSRASRIYMSGNGSRGPVRVQISFNSRWGGDCPYGTTLASGEVCPTAITWTAPTTPDPGILTGPVTHSFTGLTGVKSWELTMNRGQIFSGELDGDVAPYDVESTTFSATMSVTQRADASTFITSSGGFSLNLATDKTSTTGRCNLAFYGIVQDNPYVRDANTVGLITTEFTLADIVGGTNPVTITSY